MTAPSNEEKKRKDAQAALREAVREAVQEEIVTFREAVRQVIREEPGSQVPVTQQGQQSDVSALSAELGAIDTQLETIRAELQFIRTAVDLLVKAGQAQALANEARATYRGALATTTRPGEEAAAEMVAPEIADSTRSGYDAALPLPKDIKLPGRSEGPAPIVLETQRQGVKR